MKNKKPFKILSIDEVNKLKYDYLLKEVKRVNLYANALRARELKKMKAANLPEAQAYSQREGYKSNKTISFKGNKSMSLNELRHRYTIARNFLETKTKTREGFEKSLLKFSQEKNISYDILSNEQTSSLLWEIVNKLKEDHFDIVAGSVTNLIQLVSDELIKEIEIKDDEYNIDSDVLYNKLYKKLTKQYEKTQLELEDDPFNFGSKD